MAPRSWLTTPLVAAALVVAPLVVVGLLATLLAAVRGTDPRYALAVRRDGDRLTVSAYGHCPRSEHLRSLTVSTYDPSTQRATEVLWEVHGGVNDRLTARSIVVGVVPAGWVKTVDNLAGRPLGPSLRLDFHAAYHWEVAVDTRKLADGRARRVVAQAVFWENARERRVICG
ncbi:MAG: hypothetical protein ACJ73S_25555 [Mycobacteriales bacterium]